jgi:hypothetical protein
MRARMFLATCRRVCTSGGTFVRPGIVNFDVLFAKGDRVCLRYTAEGSHRGQPHANILPTGRTACWSTAAIFRVRDGKLCEFIKDWNKLSMWEQLGRPVSECLTVGPVLLA